MIRSIRTKYSLVRFIQGI